jgi:threonylcarbamoyladenosine tRNA methylthiotransferase MtaB
MSSYSDKFGCFTLGCRLNQCESDALIGEFIRQGYAFTRDESEPLRVCILNTCAVTARGEQKSRQALTRMRKKHPDALILVTGCAVEHNRRQFLHDKKMIFIGNDRKHALAGIAAHALRDFEDAENFSTQITPDRFAYAPADPHLHTRASLKVEDGCDNECSYCIVPGVRGKAISLPIPACLEKARALLRLGYKEIVLTGVNLQQYRDPDSGEGLVPLARALLALEGEFRLRLSSIEPDENTQEVVRLFAGADADEKLPLHLHLCLQSGSDRILSLMRRRYRARDFSALAAALREGARRFNLTADVIVGFPGESDEDFADTLALARECGLSHAHIFPYSPRPGCASAALPDQPSKECVRMRILELRRVVQENRKAFLLSLIGVEEKILVEKAHPGGGVSGYGRLYIPVRIPTARAVNSFVDCAVTGLANDGRDGLIAACRE